MLVSVSPVLLQLNLTGVLIKLLIEQISAQLCLELLTQTSHAHGFLTSFCSDFERNS